MRISFDLTVKLDAFTTARQFRAYRKARADFLHRQKAATTAGIELAETPPEKPRAAPPHRLTITLDLAGQGLDSAEQRALLMRLAEATEGAATRAAAEYRGPG